MKISIFWDMMPCSLEEIYLHFGGMFFHLQGTIDLPSILKMETARFFQNNGKLLPDYTFTSKKTIVIFSSTFLGIKGNNLLMALNLILPILLPLELLID
jgi:hypothetical protein